MLKQGAWGGYQHSQACIRCIFHMDMGGN